MVTADFVRTFSLSFTDAEEQPHFEIPSYRVKKKIFLTHNQKENRVCVRLSSIDQDVFCTSNKEIIYPVPNKWGKFGWTLINLKKVKKEIFKDAVTCSYCLVAPKALAKLHAPEAD